MDPSKYSNPISHLSSKIKDKYENMKNTDVHDSKNELNKK